MFYHGIGTLININMRIHDIGNDLPWYLTDAKRREWRNGMIINISYMDHSRNSLLIEHQ